MGAFLLLCVFIVIVALALAFFLQYAFANDWITEPVRVVIGVLPGLAPLAGAARSAAGGFQMFAQGLVGAGIAILYLSVYASSNAIEAPPRPVCLSRSLFVCYARLQARRPPDVAYRRRPAAYTRSPGWHRSAGDISHSTAQGCIHEGATQ